MDEKNVAKIEAAEKEDFVGTGIIKWFNVNKFCLPDEYPKVVQTAEAAYGEWARHYGIRARLKKMERRKVSK